MTEEQQYFEQQDAAKEESQRRAEERADEGQTGLEENAEGEQVTGGEVTDTEGQTQLGPFSAEQQNEDREEEQRNLNEEAELNVTDPALPNVDESNLGDAEESDRDLEEIKATQGENPSDNEGQENQ